MTTKTSIAETLDRMGNETLPRPLVEKLHTDVREAFESWAQLTCRFDHWGAECHEEWVEHPPSLEEVEARRLGEYATLKEWAEAEYTGNRGEKYMDVICEQVREDVFASLPWDQEVIAACGAYGEVVYYLDACVDAAWEDLEKLERASKDVEHAT